MVTKTSVQESTNPNFKTFRETNLYKRLVKEGKIDPELDERERLELENLPKEEADAKRVERLHAALDALAEELRKNGVTLEDLIESGREIREEIYQEKYAHLLNK